jgi:hypothetical protein
VRHHDVAIAIKLVILEQAVLVELDNSKFKGFLVWFDSVVLRYRLVDCRQNHVWVARSVVDYVSQLSRVSHTYI